ncbi:MAG: C25 family cysteine peptidase, partial [Flavobacteriales bacterium]
MKKLFTTAFTSLLAVWSFGQSTIQFLGQTEQLIELSCDVQDYQVNHDGVYTSILLQDGNPILKAGAPDVEQLTTSVIVDDHSEMTLSVTHATFEEFHDVYIRPSKGNLLRTVNPENVPFQEGPAYSQDVFFPGALASLGEAYIQRQFRGQSVHFFPVQYNPVTHVLRVYSNIQVAVSPTGNPGQNPLNAVTESTTNATFKEVYERHFINYPQHADRYDQVGELGNMLVITHAMYMDELEPWVAWKNEKGIATEVVDVADFANLAAMNAFIENYYNTNGLTYLMTVGDEDQIPVQLLNNSGGQGYCDQCYGYIAGNDSYSEILIGHFLVHTATELPAIINKTLEYEKNPNTAVDWFSVAMGIGSNEGAGIGDDNQADWEHQNGLKSDLLAYTYTDVYERYDGNHASVSPTPGDITSDASGSPAASTLTDVIESGCSLINYTGHGAHNLIVTGSYTNTQINQLQNNGYYPYFIVVGCCTGDYDDDDASGDTFGEAWIKSANANAPTGGIGGAFSSVYQSWAPPMEGQDEMIKIITETAAINTRHTLGSIHTHGCAGMNDTYGVDGDDMTDTWILMGDATVQLRTAFPTQITATHPTSAFFGISSITVACNTEDALICLTLNGEIIATGLVTGGQAVLNFAPVTGPGSILVTATSFNTIPYQGYIELVPANGPFLIGALNGINDAQGNGNGLADVTEAILLNADAENIGVETASAVTAYVTCANPFVVIDNANHTYGDVIAGGTVTGEGAFTFHTTSGIADQTPVTFVVVYSDALGNTWTSNLIVIIQAPKFSCAGNLVVTEVSGNGNGRLDGGETIQLI